MTALALVLRASGRWSATIRSYVAISKPRIILLLLATTVPAMVVAEGGWPSTALVIATLVGGTASAAGANAVNCWYDRDIDALMRRTQSRPLVQGDIPPLNALLFGVALGVGAFAFLWATTNLLAGVLAAAAFLFYVFVYTVWLKRRSSQNIVVGGAAGAFPPMVGWAAVTGELAWAPVIMFAIIFFWTPAALLGAGPAHCPRLSGGGRADAAGAGGRSGDAAADPGVLAGARADHAFSPPDGHSGVGLRGSGRSGRGGIRGNRVRAVALARASAVDAVVHVFAGISCGDLHSYGD